MDTSSRLVVFSLDDQRYALHLTAVEKAVRAVEITPLPKAPDIVFGVVNIRGQIVPVVNMRRRFGLPERDLRLSDQIVIARTSRRTVALVVDAVAGVTELSGKNLVAPEKIVPRMEYVEGVVKLADGLVLIHDLDKFLSLDEERTLDVSLNADG